MTHSRQHAEAAMASAKHREREAIELLLSCHDYYVPLLYKKLNTEDMTTEDMESLEEGIRRARRAIDIAWDAPGLVFYYRTLAGCLEFRFQLTRTLNDIEEAIRVRRLAVGASMEDAERQAEQLHSLAEAIAQMYSKKYAPADLDEAICLERQAIAMAPDSPDQATYLNFLAHRLGEKYSRTRAIRDLDEAILLQRQAIELTPEGPDRARYLIALAHRFDVEYSKTETEVQENIILAQQALDISSDGPTRSLCLQALAHQINDRFMLSSRKMSDIDYAISLAEEALSDGRHGVDRSSYFGTLATLLLNRYVRLGNITDLHRGISLAREAVEGKKSNEKETEMLNILAFGLSLAHEREPWKDYGEEGMQVARRTLGVTPEGHPKWHIALRLFGECLINRFRSTRALSDIEEAIVCTRKAAKALTEAHPEWAHLAARLANQLHMKYMVTEDAKCLQEAIVLGEQALAATPVDHSRRPQQLAILCNLFESHYLQTDSVTHLEKSILLARESVEAMPEDYSDFHQYLNRLGHLLVLMHSKTEEATLLDEAISLFKRAVELVKDDEKALSGTLCSLATSLFHRYKDYTQDITDLEHAITLARHAVRHAHSSPIHRILAGHVLVEFHFETGQLPLDELYDDAKLAVSLIPRLVSPSLEGSDMQHLLTNGMELASIAASVALEAGKGPLAALDLLERGRGVIASSLGEVRSDLSGLRESHPSLSDRLFHLQKALSIPTSQDSGLMFHESHDSSRKARFDRRYDAGREFDKLVDEIRTLPGFETFLGPPNVADMKAAARNGPIVIITATMFRSDAILVERDQIRDLPLPDLSWSDVQTKSAGANPESLEILEWLWDTIACPVLDFLGFDQPISDDNWPRMWWIPTGRLAKFPLHAAGYYYPTSSSKSVLDRAISSYSSSIKSMVHSYRRHNQLLLSGSAILVAMPDTPGQNGLRHTVNEVSTVRDVCNSMSLASVLSLKRKKDVMLHLRSCEIFHFAGHGHIDPSDPSKSQLLLEDWQTDPFCVSDLQNMNLYDRLPFLAYLSACGTGQVKNKDFLDESIHLISACQLAGFRHVVGTLWEVDDKISVDMARITYEEIRDKGAMDESVCRAVHNASRVLRARWIQEIWRQKRLVRSQYASSKEASGQGNMSPGVPGEPEDAPVETSLGEQRKPGRGYLLPGWMWGPDHRSVRALVGGFRPSVRNSADNKWQRKVIAVEDENRELAERALWVPYVHFGV